MERALLKLILLSLAIGFSLSDRECRARNAFFNPETSRCYLFLRGVWLNEAQEKCKENGYELISIENQTMNDFVLGLSRNHLKNNNVTGRVGIHYKGIPKWHHRKKVYHNFDENQGYVIHAQYIKHLCTVMNISTGLWYQIDCYKRLYPAHWVLPKARTLTTGKHMRGDQGPTLTNKSRVHCKGGKSLPFAIPASDCATSRPRNTKSYQKKIMDCAVKGITKEARASPAGDAFHQYSPDVAKNMRGLLALKGHTSMRKNRTIRQTSINVGTLTGRSREHAETLKKRRVDIACVQETKWKGVKSRDISDGYKLIYYGTTCGREGVAIIVSDSYRDIVTGVKRVFDRLMSIKVTEGGDTLRVVCAYAPQCGCTDEMKECFYRDLEALTQEFKENKSILIGGDFNALSSTHPS
ncbi:hypothetical protein Y032_0082g1598 [Ancylostoma ceylanicum]|uniref:Endonuclease/exonuclease/phosphatase domain-containing protein n=1 Tax=Ancylostoma ceylanicum TaxID=53326 RepID=A0A016TS41_9BILA|nr:hypothetical protein Y032_0082g1598 [Ancylostoma ceylanicum]